MQAVTNTTVLDDGGKFVTVVDDNGATLTVSGSDGVVKSTIHLNAAQTRLYAEFLHSAEDVRDLEILTVLQNKFETEMGAELIAYNSQALVKDDNRVYTQAVTRLSFESYQKGLDGLPA